jgi:hypothetical protein
MKFEDIFDAWDKDSKIDKTELGDESLNIPRLHHKYYTMLVAERSVLRRLEADMKQLKLDKYEFYAHGHTEETKAKGWKLPPRGLILKGDVPMFVEADKDMIDLSLRIGVQQEKVEFLDSIIKTLNTRNFIIKNCLDYLKFMNGG